MSKKLKFVLPFVNDGSCPDWAKIEVLAAYATPPSRRKASSSIDLADSTNVETHDQAPVEALEKASITVSQVPRTTRRIRHTKPDEMSHAIPWATGDPRWPPTLVDPWGAELLRLAENGARDRVTLSEGKQLSSTSRVLPGVGEPSTLTPEGGQLDRGSGRHRPRYAGVRSLEPPCRKGYGPVDNYHPSAMALRREPWTLELRDDSSGSGYRERQKERPRWRGDPSPDRRGYLRHIIAARGDPFARRNIGSRALEPPTESGDAPLKWRAPDGRLDRLPDRARGAPERRYRDPERMWLAYARRRRSDPSGHPDWSHHNADRSWMARARRRRHWVEKERTLEGCAFWKGERWGPPHGAPGNERKQNCEHIRRMTHRRHNAPRATAPPGWRRYGNSGFVCEPRAPESKEVAQ